MEDDKKLQRRPHQYYLRKHVSPLSLDYEHNNLKSPVASKRKYSASPTWFLSPHRFPKYKKSLRPRTSLKNLNDCSFEQNQTLPHIRTMFKTVECDSDSSTSKVKQNMEIVRVDGPNGVRFNSSLASLSESPVTSSFTPSISSERTSQTINPNKAVFTIDSKTSQILIVNSRACSLLGYSSAELCSMKLDQLMRVRPQGSLHAAAMQEGSLNTDDGTMVLMSGKVVEMYTGSGKVIVVSLWIRQLDQDGPCLAVAEPVHIKQTVLYVDGENGLTVGCDSEEAALIFQCENIERLSGINISILVPSIHLPSKDVSEIPKSIAKQKATGRTFDGTTFPLCLWIKNHDPNDKSVFSEKENHQMPKHVYDITIRVYHNVSGLLVVDESGVITACNHHFTMLTFGKSYNEVIGRNIISIITDFCQESHLIHPSAPRSRNITFSPVNHDNSDSDTDLIGDRSCRSPTSNSIITSQVSNVTKDKSSSAICMDKSSSLHNLDKTHTPTPTQDMVSSISTTEHRLDVDSSFIPDIMSGVSNISIEDEYHVSSISKSRSENILGSDNRENNINLANKNNDMKLSDKSDSTYFSSRKSMDYSTTGTAKGKANDVNMRLNFEPAKARPKSGTSLLDRSNMSLDLCDSNETSADFLTPINEMPLSHGDGFSEELDLLSEKSLALKSIDKVLKSDIKTFDPSDSPNKQVDNWINGTPKAERSQVITSTPQITRQSSTRLPSAPSYPLHPLHHQQHKDATYKGVVLHKDGTELSVVYTASGVRLRGGGNVVCVWVAVVSMEPNVLNASSINSTAENSISIVHKQGSHNLSRPLSISLVSQCGEEQTSGDYNKNYVTLKQIGKGAYGCVKMAYRRSDKLLVVAKFILKEKVSEQFWVENGDKNGKKVPLEVSLLQTLKHPNIVSILDVYENDKYFQMIMKKHGSGMDLFEFIERWPALDEPLRCFIFRQIAQAIEYLHSLSILHRDIKDENVIIDNKFHVQLIDFGSATFRHDISLFSAFYGTIEYCSPEVLAGNKYAGPELEMWSMGVTLYILTFYQNPFTDVEDIIQAVIALPRVVSEDLEHLLRWMLCKNPEDRCTIPQLMAHPWLNQKVNIGNYSFTDVIDCEPQEAVPEIYYSGWGCSGSPLSGEEDAPSLTSHSATVSHTDPLAHALPLPSDSKTTAVLQDGSSGKQEVVTRSKSSKTKKSQKNDKDAQSDNYSLRSSAEILDISKPMSDVSSDATGKSACEFEDMDDHYDCDSWDECDQESLS